MNAFLFVSFLILTPYNYFSITTSERSLGVFQNPAGLGIHQGSEIYFSIKRGNTNMYKWNYALSLGPLGFSANQEEEEKDGNYYTFALGTKISNFYSLGWSYEWGPEKYKLHKFGAMLTPFKFLRIASVYKLQKEDDEIVSGIALQPGTDRIIASFDVSFWDTINSFIYGVSLEPIQGIKLFAGAQRLAKIKENRFFGGVELLLENLRFTGSSYQKVPNPLFFDDFYHTGSITLSREIYPTIFKRKKEWVKLELKGNYPEERKISGLFTIKSQVSFYDLINSFKKIEASKEIKGIILYFNYPHFSPAQAEELYTALLSLKEKGKKIVSIGESFNFLNYSIASISDKIVIVPTGDILIHGLYMEIPYIKNLFEKIGVEPELERIGKYKSAVEPLIRENMSTEDRFQREEYLKDLEELLIEEIAKGKNVSKDKVNEWIEKGYFNSEDAVKYGLVDTSAFYDEIEDLCKKWFGTKVSAIPYEKLAKRKILPREFKDTRPVIALLVGEGAITTGESSENPLPIIGGKMMGSETMSELIHKIEKDKNIKAVVFRVNSPGGSALASEIIWNGIRKLKEKKPVVVSMGSVAGSGGYYIACPGTKIFADKSTITGSIGIISGKLVLKEFFENLGITFDRVKTRTHSDAFSSTRPFDEQEREVLKRETEWGYRQFVQRVSSSRNIPFERVDSLGQGRIYSGIDAKEIKLIDEVGGLFSAIESAKELAGIKGDVKIVVYPTPKWYEFPEINKKVSLKTPYISSSREYLYLMPFVPRIR